ncbi:MAG: matrixin family metalloprotease [Candidatus Polarisedimenticolia bacterium]
MMRPTARTRGRMAIALVGIALLIASAGGLRASGNLEVITKSGTAIGMRVWPDAALPIEWRFHDPTTFPTCSYVSANAPAGTLQGAHQSAFNEWQNLPDSRVSFTYGGTTGIRNVALDGINLVTMCDAGVLASNLGFVASTPSFALTVPVTVVAGGGCPPGKGILPGTSFCFPEGTHPAGTMVDADIRYNTFSTREQAFSTNGTTQGSLDIWAVALHEQGHFFGLSHDPLSNAVMFPFTDDIPFSEAVSKRLVAPSDATTAGRYYPEPSYGAGSGSITGRITLNGIAADGVHVVAVNPATMLGAAGRFSLSRFGDPDALGPEGPDFASSGAGFYRIDGLPPGEYYVYAEYFDNSEFLSTRLQNRYNSTIGNSNTSNGNPGSGGQSGGWLGFLPQLAEFWNAGESGNGGDGVNPGTAADNSDVGTLVSVQAGAVTAGIDIAINIEPPNGQTPAQRQNPTSRAVLPNDALQGSDVIIGFLLNGGTDDFYAIRYPASLLPAPPYNVAEGLWARSGRNTSPMVTRITYGNPANPNVPALDDPVLMPAGRVVTGGPGGLTSGGDFIDVRDQWNVTINDSRDLWIIVNQPAAPAGTTLLTQGFFAIAARTATSQARVNRTLLTQNGGTTYTNLTADVVYDLITEADAPVMITGASPVSREEGERADVSILGEGFQDGATVSFGNGITVNSVNFVSPQELTANVKIADTGASQPRAVSVTVTNLGAVFPNVSRVFNVLPSTNRAPVAVADATDVIECTSPDGAAVTLDGSGSTDEDSTADTHDDIVKFEWFEDYGTASETLLGTGETIEVTLPLGTHDITLVVTDTHDATGTDAVQVQVVDTTPPTMIASLLPELLWPPNHSLMEVTAQVGAFDLCSEATVSLVSVTSSEADDAQGGGDGHTTGDVENVGTAGIAFLLRAERLGQGEGRTYTAVYLGSDASGNTATVSATSVVPHSQGGSTDPLVLSVRETGSGTVVDWLEVPGAHHYNVIRGSVRGLYDAGPDYGAGPVTCLEALSLNTTSEEAADSLVPAPGEALFYLVEYNDGWARSYGTEEAGKALVPGPGSCEP